MVLGRVVGTVVATQKDAGLLGTKLQVVQAMDPGDLRPRGGFVVAVDSVGAGEGEVVLYTSGSSARQTRATEAKPVDAVIVAIVDSVEIEGKTVYQKAQES
ncbi:MAG: ethanolamine utilization protein EutN [Candidatus Handelsmanbacteria bacterium RIFCSPLOWO2_12_FULL_64_10]|uniref:Ethanolamine utilization protein EutN n=1 Tax=Handelsmanbacteria sp. (strain RIFCSPLOWO2_12_FULL_64_10) TaxID=1817868 RepID=A0A1F6CB35_HANXR|nr:MAG: ethanolamine utilization protein EutN [Candidatus Handelsmanbacteria bacterium RIFCSPLOWO2_12_FULL_64_10]